jgi:UDP-N-acetylglucosamine pyrophosphorylase
MTSTATDEQTRKIFEQANYFGYNKEFLHFFK